MSDTSSPSTPAGPAPAGAEFWKKYFTFYDTLNNAIPYRQMIDRHVDLLRPSKGDRILDAGTGTGNVALALLASGATVIGTDFCEDALITCRQKMPGADFQFADITKRIPFEDAAFDKLACCNVIYTLRPEGQVVAVRELSRVLRPGGLAAITVFAAGFNSLKVYRETLRLHYEKEGVWSAGVFGLRHLVNTTRILYYVRRIRMREQSGDYTFYTPEQLTTLLEGAGFEVLSTERTFGGECLLAVARKRVN